MSTPLFIDFEASGLGKGSYPIEIGWCDADGCGEAHLIRPLQKWNKWDRASERVHGISHEELTSHGEDVGLVALRFLAVCSEPGQQVLSDAIDSDQAWLRQLMAVAAVGSPFELSSLWGTVGRCVSGRLRAAGVPSSAVPTILYSILLALEEAHKARGPMCHRALADARRNAQIWCDARKLADEVAGRWAPA